jgi:hypothetical protein
LFVFLFSSILLVTVPEGIEAGHAIRVRSPDGRQVTNAIVPDGCGPGQTFYLEFPKQPANAADANLPSFMMGACVDEIDLFLTPNPTIPEVTATPLPADPMPVPDARILRTIIPQAQQADTNSLRDSPETTTAPESAVARSAGDDTKSLEELTPLPVADEATSPATTAPPVPLPAQPEIQQVEQKILLVKVPEGMPAGATIHVEIPGEHRTVAAMIPAGASSFHMCYTPRPLRVPAPTTTQAWKVTPEEQPVRRAIRPTPIAPPTQANASLVSRIPTPAGQKLLLVRVPPGTAAGTTIHVTVPDEPGRILAAVVPPGKQLREFHVSYETRRSHLDLSPRSSFIAPASPYRNGLQQQQQRPSQPTPEGLPQATRHGLDDTMFVPRLGVGHFAHQDAGEYDYHDSHDGEDDAEEDFREGREDRGAF